MSSKAKLLFLATSILFLTSCGEIGHFEKPDVGNVCKVEAYFTEENLAKFYDSVSQPEEDYASCSVEVDGGRLCRAWMKVRGYTSRGDPKKNFSLKIEENGTEKVYALMHEGGTWFKNRIVMYAYNNYMYNGEALTAAPDTKAGALFVNGKYYGYYAIVDVYDEPTLKSWKRGPVSELFKVRLDSYEDNPLYSKTEKKFPKDKNYSSFELLVSNVTRLSPSEWETWALQYLDIDSIIRYLVVHDFFGIEDTEIQNFYIYNYGKMAILPWDNELGMELGWNEFYGHNRLTERILEIPSVRAKYVDAMKSFIADTAFFEGLKNKVNEWYNQSYKAIESDPVFYFDIDDCTRVKNEILSFIDRRRTDPALVSAFP